MNLDLQYIDDLIRSYMAALGWPLEGLARLILAGMVGGLIGLERELRGRHAGFRTNLLVCFGSCLAMIVSTHFALTAWPLHPGTNLNVDPARIAYGIMTGVGFLGAGCIVQRNGGVRGLTTAAALWCVAALGLAAGFGLYLLTVLACGLILIALWLLAYFEEAFPKRKWRKVVVRRPWEAGAVRQTVKKFKEAKLDVVNVSFHRAADSGVVDVTLLLGFFDKNRYYDFERQMEAHTEGYELLSAEDA
jgi:putative Mg2+ transporter-C (MgtC) family protein